MKGKSLVGFLVLQALAAAGQAQTPQIEWFAKEGMTYLVARSYVRV